MQLEAILFMVYMGTLLFPVIYGMLVYSKIAHAYRPMVIFIWILFVIKFIDAFIRSDNAFFKILSELEPLLVLALIAWQARRWRIFDKRPKIFWVMITVAIHAWTGEQVLAEATPSGISWFSVGSSFLVTLVAIELLNRTMISSPGPLFRNPIFLFSIALIFFYTFSGLLQVFMLVGQYSGKAVADKAYYFYIILAIFTNIIYLRSFLCIPPKTNYSLS